MRAVQCEGGGLDAIGSCLAIGMNMKRANLLGRLQSSLWFIPLMYAVLGLAISGVTMFVDQRTDYQLLSMDFIGGPDAALAILGTVAASMVSLLATVLAITMVVVQLAMAQFSPRIVQTFLQDRPSQNAIGLFVATFVVAMLSMRGVQVSEEEPVVPGFSVLVVFMLVVVDIVVLVTYIHHIGRSLRVSALIEMVGTNTRSLLDEIYPHTVQPGQDQRSEDPHVVRADHSGVLSLIGHEHLVELATEVDGTIEVIPALGQYVSAGSPLVRLRGVTAADVDLARLRGALRLSLERTLEQDVAFGLRMLVDMGIKALSESPFADPTTTVQVIDRVHDLMRQLARRELPDGVRYDDSGVARLLVPSMDWQAYVRLAFEELRLAGSGSPQVSRRLRASLEDLMGFAPLDRRAALSDQLELLHASTERAVADPQDLDLSRHPDPQGLGIAAGMIPVEPDAYSRTVNG